MQPRLEQGDCLSVLRGIGDDSVNLILSDLPYGCLNRQSVGGQWDCKIPLAPLWEQFLRVAKRNAAIIIFAQGMFTARLMMSQPKFWRYNLVWSKVRPSGFLNANRQPLRGHEDICVFYREQPTYNPQCTVCDDGQRTHSRGRLDKGVTNSCYGRRRETPTQNPNRKYPTSVLTFPKPPPSEIVHPTQKPVELLRHLIRTYTNSGDTVLDATMGSGSTGVAAVLEGRCFIGIERDDQYFTIASRRISEAVNIPIQPEFAF